MRVFCLNWLGSPFQSDVRSAPTWLFLWAGLLACGFSRSVFPPFHFPLWHARHTACLAGAKTFRGNRNINIVRRLWSIKKRKKNKHKPADVHIPFALATAPCHGTTPPRLRRTHFPLSPCPVRPWVPAPSQRRMARQLKTRPLR